MTGFTLVVVVVGLVAILGVCRAVLWPGRGVLPPRGLVVFFQPDERTWIVARVRELAPRLLANPWLNDLDGVRDRVEIPSDDLRRHLGEADASGSVPERAALLALCERVGVLVVMSARTYEEAKLRLLRERPGRMIAGRPLGDGVFEERIELAGPSGRG